MEEGPSSVQHPYEVRSVVLHVLRCSHHPQQTLTLRRLVSKGTLKTKARYMRQGVTLAGLDTQVFDKALDNMGRLYAEFSRYVGESELAPIGFITAGGGGSSVDISNRYFTSRGEDPHSPGIPFDPSVDPTGALASCTGHDLFHGEDNEVQYYQRKKTTEVGKAAYVCFFVVLHSRTGPG